MATTSTVSTIAPEMDTPAMTRVMTRVPDFDVLVDILNVEQENRGPASLGLLATFMRCSSMAIVLECCTDEDLHSLARSASLLSPLQLTDNRKCIVTSGDSLHSIYIVMEGEVLVTNAEGMNRPRGTGTVLGLSVLSGRSVWNVDMFCTNTSTTLCVLPAEDVIKCVGITSKVCTDATTEFWKRMSLWNLFKGDTPLALLLDEEAGEVLTVDEVRRTSDALKSADAERTHQLSHGSHANTVTVQSQESENADTSKHMSENSVEDFPMVKQARIRQYNTGDCLCSQGDARRYCYIVLKGEIAIHRRLDGDIKGRVADSKPVDDSINTSKQVGYTTALIGPKNTKEADMKSQICLDDSMEVMRMHTGNYFFMDGEPVRWLEEKLEAIRARNRAPPTSSAVYAELAAVCKMKASKLLFGIHKHTLVAITKAEVITVPLRSIAKSATAFRKFLETAEGEMGLLYYTDIELMQYETKQKQWVANRRNVLKEICRVHLGDQMDQERHYGGICARRGQLSRRESLAERYARDAQTNISIGVRGKLSSNVASNVASNADESDKDAIARRLAQRVLQPFARERDMIPHLIAHASHADVYITHTHARGRHTKQFGRKRPNFFRGEEKKIQECALRYMNSMIESTRIEGSGKILKANIFMTYICPEKKSKGESEGPATCTREPTRSPPDSEQGLRNNPLGVDSVKSEFRRSLEGLIRKNKESLNKDVLSILSPDGEEGENDDSALFSPLSMNRNESARRDQPKESRKSHAGSPKQGQGSSVRKGLSPGLTGRKGMKESPIRGSHVYNRSPNPSPEKYAVLTNISAEQLARREGEQGETSCGSSNKRDNRNAFYNALETLAESSGVDTDTSPRPVNTINSNKNIYKKKRSIDGSSSQKSVHGSASPLSASSSALSSVLGIDDEGIIAARGGTGTPGIECRGPEPSTPNGAPSIDNQSTNKCTHDKISRTAKRPSAPKPSFRPSHRPQPTGG